MQRPMLIVFLNSWEFIAFHKIQTFVRNKTIKMLENFAHNLWAHGIHRISITYRHLYATSIHHNRVPRGHGGDRSVIWNTKIKNCRTPLKRPFAWLSCLWIILLLMWRVTNACRRHPNRYLALRLEYIVYGLLHILYRTHEILFRIVFSLFHGWRQLKNCFRHEEYFLGNVCVNWGLLRFWKMGFY